LCCRTTQIYTVSSYTRVHTHTYTHVHTHTHAHVRTRSSSHVQARKQTSTQMSGGWTPTDAATSTFSSSAPTRGPTDLHQIKHYGDGTEGRLKDLRPCDSDTPIQRRMKLARLRRCDVLTVAAVRSSSSSTRMMMSSTRVCLRGAVPCGRLSLSLPIAPCRLPSVQSMIMHAQANHYHPRALTTHTPPIIFVSARTNKRHHLQGCSPSTTRSCATLAPA